MANLGLVIAAGTPEKGAGIRHPPGVRIQRVERQVPGHHARAAFGSESQVIHGPIELLVADHHAGVTVPEMSCEQRERFGPGFAAVVASEQQQIIVPILGASLIGEQVEGALMEPGDGRVVGKFAMGRQVLPPSPLRTMCVRLCSALLCLLHAERGTTGTTATRLSPSSRTSPHPST